MQIKTYVQSNASISGLTPLAKNFWEILWETDLALN